MSISFSKPIAVIADIHGNHDALAAVLNDIDAQDVSAILNLGDHFSGPLAAAETADTLMSREMTNILGNHDRYLIEQSPEDMGASDEAAYNQLSDGHLEWLRNLPRTNTISDEIFMCHGTPSSDETYWLEDVLPSGQIVFRDRLEIEADARGVDCPLILCAHTHTARTVRLSDGRLIVNPGSVGLPAYDDDVPVYHVMQTGSPDAQYALVRKIDDMWRVDFRSVPYDSTRMASMARDGHRDGWANALSTGWLE